MPFHLALRMEGLFCAKPAPPWRGRWSSESATADSGRLHHEPTILEEVAANQFCDSRNEGQNSEATRQQMGRIFRMGSRVCPRVMVSIKIYAKTEANWAPLQPPFSKAFCGIPNLQKKPQNTCENTSAKGGACYPDSLPANGAFRSLHEGGFSMRENAP